MHPAEPLRRPRWSAGSYAETRVGPRTRTALWRPNSRLETVLACIHSSRAQTSMHRSISPKSRRLSSLLAPIEISRAVFQCQIRDGDHSFRCQTHIGVVEPLPSGVAECNCFDEQSLQPFVTTMNTSITTGYHFRQHWHKFHVPLARIAE